MDNLNKLTDLELIEQNTEQATEALMRRYFPLVKAASARYQTGLAQDDLLQEGFIGLFKAIKSYNPQKSNVGGSLSAFAKICVENQIRNAIKKQMNHTSKITSTAADIEKFDSPYTIDSILLSGEQLAEIEKRALELSDFERQVFSFLKQGFNYKEIAGFLDKPPKSIDNTIQRLRKKFFEVL